MIDIPKEVEKSPIFNVVNLYSHSIRKNDNHMNDEQPNKENNWTKHLLKKKREQIEWVLFSKLDATLFKACMLYFIKWADLLDSYNT